MKKLIHYPFLCILVISMIAGMPFLWQQMGLLDRFSPAESIVADDPIPQIAPPPTLSAEEPPASSAEVRMDSAPQPGPSEPVPEVAEPLPDQPISDNPELSEDGPLAAGEEPSAPAESHDNGPEESPQPPEKPENPFENALFIGDSRTVGIAKYSGITEADFFATTGMDVYSVFKNESTTGSWEKGTLLEDVLTEKQYDRIYIMLGINELGYNFNHTVETYEALLNRLRELQPDAYLIIEANLQVSKKRSDTDKVINKATIDRMNEAQAAFADGKTVFYVDVNPLFCTEDGTLDDTLSFDGTHPYGKYYAMWADWLRENTPA